VEARNFHQTVESGEISCDSLEDEGAMKNPLPMLGVNMTIVFGLVLPLL